MLHIYLVLLLTVHVCIMYGHFGHCGKIEAFIQHHFNPQAHQINTNFMFRSQEGYPTLPIAKIKHDVNVMGSMCKMRKYAILEAIMWLQFQNYTIFDTYTHKLTMLLS